jgi:formate dehydrogenase
LLAEVQAWLGDAPLRRDRLIEYLHAVNDRLRCLPAPHLAALAHLMWLSQAEVFEVASFYHHFDVVKEGADGQVPQAPAPTVGVIAAPCVGRCDTAPAAAVNQGPVPHATPQAVAEAVAAGRTTEVVAGHIDLDAYVAQGGYRLLQQCHASQHPADSVIQTLEAAGLRGLGGAGFSAGRKWRIVREQPAPRLLAVNADEGEPGTFKDRWLLERDPQRFLEGLFVAAWAVGVEKVFIYLRDEYHGCRALL